MVLRILINVLLRTESCKLLSLSQDVALYFKDLMIMIKMYSRASKAIKNMIKMNVINS